MGGGVFICTVRKWEIEVSCPVFTVWCVCVREEEAFTHMLNFASFRKQVSHGEGGHDDTAPDRIGKEIEKQIICFDRNKK